MYKSDLFPKTDAIIQPKFDGFRAHLMPDGSFISRNHVKFSISLKNVDALGPIFDSRALALDGEILPRSGNFSDLGKVKSKEEFYLEEDKFYFVCFDYVPKKQSETFATRLLNLVEFFAENKENIGGAVELSLSEYCESHDDAIKFLDTRAKTNKWEGVIVRDGTAEYKNGYSNGVLKLKCGKLDNEYEITGAHFEDNNGKKLIVYEVKVGNIVCSVRPKGSETERERLWQTYLDTPEEIIGKKLWVEYQEITVDGSLRFPSTKTDSSSTYFRDPDVF